MVHLSQKHWRIILPCWFVFFFWFSLSNWQYKAALPWNVHFWVPRLYVSPLCQVRSFLTSSLKKPQCFHTQLSKVVSSCSLVEARTWLCWWWCYTLLTYSGAAFLLYHCLPNVDPTCLPVGLVHSPQAMFGWPMKKWRTLLLQLKRLVFLLPFKMAWKRE